MRDWKDRVPLRNGKNNILKFALSAGMSHEQLLSALIDGAFADVFYNQALPGTENTGVVQIGTVANKAFFDALVEECNALSNNLSYDVKMLQLQQILEGNHPNMMGGMIEAFYTTNNLQTKQNVTVTTGALGKCVFNGTSNLASSWSYPGGSNGTEGTPTMLLIGTEKQGNYKEIKISVSVRGGDNYDGLGTKQPPTASFVRLARGIEGASVNDKIGTISLLGNQHDEYTGTASFKDIYAGGITEFGVLLESASYQGTYGSFYESSDPPTGNEFVGEPGTGFSQAAHAVEATVTFTFYEQDLPEDGILETKRTNLIATVSGGAMYLHHSTIPSGASLTPKVQLGSGGWSTLERDEKDTNRPVTVGGRSMYETRYWLPADIPNASTATLQVVGHRSSTSQKLELYDMMFAGR